MRVRIKRRQKHISALQKTVINTESVVALQDTFKENSRGAEIAVSADGYFVYASNRGHDSIAVVAIVAAKGQLSPIGWRPSGGKTPRFFAWVSSDKFYCSE
jgi:6-phosphogluconolactonase